MDARILVVEDERAIADVVEFALRRAGFTTRTATSLAAARSVLRGEGADFVILDLGLPDGDGLDLCRELRRDSDLPVLMLTCRDHEVDRVVGLETGADDYVVKPFSARELVARVRTILRRTAPTTSRKASAELRHGRVSLSREQHRAWLDEHTVALTPTEFQLLTTLMGAPARAFSRPSLARRVYGDRCFVSDRTIDSHVKGIRRKFAAVDATANPVETVFGVGYRAREVE
jgi:two-component system OmpR family response regulator